jgi:hypothetical protein
MKRKYVSLITGLALGAASWAIVPLVSDKFEPFDSESGFYIGQSILSIASFIFGYLYGLKHVFIFIFGSYISFNVYPFIFGSSESRAWASLGLVTTLALCFYPLAFGIFGKLVGIGKLKYNNWLKKDAAKRGAS